jgi:hypothetical protein
MEPLNIFLSDSHKAKKLAGGLKAGLEEFGFGAFLAHEDIRPSARWRTEIRLCANATFSSRCLPRPSLNQTGRTKKPGLHSPSEKR